VFLRLRFESLGTGGFVVAGDEGRLLELLLGLGLLGLGLAHLVEEIDDFLGGLLDDADEIDLLVLAVDDDLGDPGPEFLVLLAGLGEVGDVAPQFAAVLEVDQELRDVGVGALERVAEDLARAVDLQLDVDGGVAALCEGDGF
jgi:hypothetical protein